MEMSYLKEFAVAFFGLLTLASAAVVTFNPRVLYSAFALLFTFFGVAALYVLLDADFLAATQVIVYVGGILILIIFGVLLTARITNLDIFEQTQQRYLALIPVGAMVLGLIALAMHTHWVSTPTASVPTAAPIGRELIYNYVIAFEASSILLVAALIAAVRLGRERSDEDDEQ